MKTLRFFAVCALSIVCYFSYAQESLVLKSRILKNFDNTRYAYNDLNLIDTIYTDMSGADSYQCYRTFEYNEQGLLSRETNFQNFSGEYVDVYYIDYTYEADGRMATRSVYNRGGDVQCTLTAKLFWEYKDGKLDKVVTYFPGWDNPEELELFGEDRYVYSGDTLKMKETWIIPFNFNEFSKSAVVQYKYDKEGRLVEELGMNFNTETGALVSADKNTYEYDEDGNMFQYTGYIQRLSEPSVRFIYHYDTNVKNENIVYPFNHQDAPAPHIAAMKTSKNIVVKEEWWQIPMEGGALFHGGDYIWSYQDPRETSIHSISPSKGVAFFVSGGSLYLPGFEQGKDVLVYDMNGSLVKQAAYTSQGISLSNLPKGVYLARIGKQAFRFVK